MPANVDLVRSIYADWERGDYRSAEWADPEIEFVIADRPSPGRWTGLAGMAEGWRTWLETWEEFRQEAGEHRTLDEEHLLVFFHSTGPGKTSGLDLAQMHSAGAGLFQVRDSKVTKFVVYLDRDRALADLGLEA